MPEALAQMQSRIGSAVVNTLCRRFEVEKESIAWESPLEQWDISPSSPEFFAFMSALEREINYTFPMTIPIKALETVGSFIVWAKKYHEDHKY